MNWADECSSDDEALECDFYEKDKDDGFTVVQSKRRRRRKNAIAKVPEQLRERCYAIQKQYGDVSKAARTMLMGAGKHMHKSGWRLRQTKTILSLWDMQQELQYQYGTTAYVLVEDPDAQMPHFIAYSKAF